MKNKKNADSAQRKPLRLWPGVVIVSLQWLVRYGIPVIAPGDTANQMGVFGGLLGGFAIIIWWAFFSRAPRFERWFAIFLMIAALLATSQIIHISIRTTMMGLMFPVFSIPVLSLAFVAWAIASRKLSKERRLAIMVATIIVASGFWTFLRTDGMDADIHQDFAWRWAKTHEDRLLTQIDNNQITKPLDSVAMETEAEWPGFRGPDRDGIIHGVRIGTDWLKTPPVEMWRRPVGPGCSSFAIHGGLLYTQEQRGEYELVTCYDLETGEPVWSHRDSARFWDSHAGAGPRSTPTLSYGRVYTLGATGILNVLDERDGTVVWSRDAASDTGVKVLPWGFTSSPLVVSDVVIVALSGKLAAYNAASGKLRWVGPDGGNSYSSPHLITIGGILQVLLMSQSGAVSLSPTDGKQLWNYAWPSDDRILQPAVISGGDLLLAGGLNGICRITASNAQGEWTARELWTSDELKLNLNDFIIHKDHAYGFNGPRIACMDIKDGKRVWQGDLYRGWLLLLADQDLLVVLSEKGELALVEANPGQFKELARIPAIKGKTWNHPVLVGDILVVRNNQEMAAFRLSHAGD
ncbi:MAG: PQQ-binding-like beta-propeller repeat protein [Bacteroidota bacterium]